MSTRKVKPVWSDVKAQLIEFDRVDLLRLVQDLYAASNENQAFLHARFTEGDDSLDRYKSVIDRWLWPDVFKNQDVSVSKAKKAIVDYKKAVGHSGGTAELMVFYCERAAGFSNDVGMQDESFFDALVRMFEQSLKIVSTLPEGQRPALRQRLEHVRHICHRLGYGVGDAMDALLA